MFRQFEVDCIRMDITIHNCPIEKNPDVIFNTLFDTYQNISIVNKTLLYFTQIPIAKHYIEKIKEMKSGEHLLSSIPHNVTIDDKGILTIEKGFTHCYITELECYVLDIITLEIRYNPLNKN